MNYDIHISLLNCNPSLIQRVNLEGFIEDAIFEVASKFNIDFNCLVFSYPNSN